MSARITFPEAVNKWKKGLTIYRVNEVSIESSWKNQTSRAEIIIPRLLRSLDYQHMKSIFKQGSPVVIELGYNADFSKNTNNLFFEQFSGYITSVSADAPVKITCEDEMWKLKQIPVSFSAQHISLDKLLKSICPGYSIDAAEGINFDSVRFTHTTVALVLKKIEEYTGFKSYMKGKQLVCGKYYSDDSQVKPLKFELERSLVSCDLKYKENNQPLKVEVVGISNLGERVTVTKGVEGGDKYTFKAHGITNKATLEKIAKEKYDKRKAAGFEGSITTWGVPNVMHGMKAELHSALFPDRNGIYYIDGVSKVFNSGGFRQTIQIGNKI